jgi:hypothetical protein
MKLALFAFLSTICFPVMAATGVSVDSLVSTLIYLVIIALVFWLIWWFIGYVGVPEPFNKVIRVIVGLVALLILINFLLGFAGHPIVSFR